MIGIKKLSSNSFRFSFAGLIMHETSFERSDAEFFRHAQKAISLLRAGKKAILFVGDQLHDRDTYAIGFEPIDTKTVRVSVRSGETYQELKQEKGKVERSLTLPLSQVVEDMEEQVKEILGQ
jgi:hypothetical protein